MRGNSSFDTVRTIGLQLPGVEEGTMFGKPALKVDGKMFACVPSHRSAEPDSLVVRIDFEQRDELLSAEPDIYYITGHYRGYPSVLVRLPRVDASVLKDLIGTAYRFVIREAKAGKAARRAPAGRSAQQRRS